MNRNIFKISYMIHSITHVYDTQWYTHHCNVVTNVESKFQNSTIVRQPYGSRTIKVHLSLRPCGRADRADLKRFKSENDFADADVIVDEYNSTDNARILEFDQWVTEQKHIKNLK